MKNRIAILAFAGLAAISAPLFAQPGGVGVALLRVDSAPTGLCQSGDVPRWVVSTGDIWSCRSISHGQGTWTASAAGTSYLPLSGGTLSGALATSGPIANNAEFSNGTCTTAKSIDAANGNSQKVTLTAAAACALTFVQPAAGTLNLTLKIIQSSATTHNGTITGGKWPGGTVPTITATAGAVDLVKCYLDGTNALCVASQDMK